MITGRSPWAPVTGLYRRMVFTKERGKWMCLKVSENNHAYCWAVKCATLCNSMPGWVVHDLISPSSFFPVIVIYSLEQVEVRILIAIKPMWTFYTHPYTHKGQPQHRELHALLFSNSVCGFFNVLWTWKVFVRRGLPFIVPIRENLKVQPFAGVISKVALSPQLFWDPECSTNWTTSMWFQILCHSPPNSHV